MVLRPGKEEDRIESGKSGTPADITAVGYKAVLGTSPKVVDYKFCSFRRLGSKSFFSTKMEKTRSRSSCSVRSNEESQDYVSYFPPRNLTLVRYSPLVYYRTGYCLRP